MLIRMREDIAGVLNQLGLTQVAVEVGVDRGGFARDFLSKWDGDCLYCVDPWQTDLPGYVDHISWNREPDYHIAVAALAQFCDRVRILRHTSEQAARMIWHEVDFVYLDADHSYEAVKLDIQTWWPKVRAGGILAGHDWDEEHPGVEGAVSEFVRERGLELWLTTEARYKSWLVRNPQ